MPVAQPLIERREARFAGLLSLPASFEAHADPIRPRLGEDDSITLSGANCCEEAPDPRSGAEDGLRPVDVRPRSFRPAPVDFQIPRCRLRLVGPPDHLSWKCMHEGCQLNMVVSDVSAAQDAPPKNPVRALRQW